MWSLFILLLLQKKGIIHQLLAFKLLLTISRMAPFHFLPKHAKFIPRYHVFACCSCLHPFVQYSFLYSMAKLGDSFQEASKNIFCSHIWEPSLSMLLNFILLLLGGGADAGVRQCTYLLIHILYHRRCAPLICVVAYNFVKEGVSLLDT